MVEQNFEHGAIWAPANTLIRKHSQKQLPGPLLAGRLFGMFIAINQAISQITTMVFVGTDEITCLDRFCLPYT